MQEVLPNLLTEVRERFYAKHPKCIYYRDEHHLKYALTWAASWLHGRRLRISARHYEQLMVERLEDIQRYGQRCKYQTYFPRYLLTCVQDWFNRHGDGLYEQLKHVSHWIELPNMQRCSTSEEELQVELLSHLNLILRNRKPTPKKKDPQQLELF